MKEASRKKTNAPGFCLYEAPGEVRLPETRSRLVGGRDWGGWEWGLVFNGCRVLGLQDEKVLEMDVDGRQQCEWT